MEKTLEGVPVSKTMLRVPRVAAAEERWPWPGGESILDAYRRTDSKSCVLCSLACLDPARVATGVTLHCMNLTGSSQFFGVNSKHSQRCHLLLDIGCAVGPCADVLRCLLLVMASAPTTGRLPVGKAYPTPRSRVHCAS